MLNACRASKARRPVPLLIVAFVCATLAGGCGDDGPKRYHIAGKVTWAGKPIPAGVLYFDPDIANGKDGPQGFAIIKDGQFDTRNNGQGHGGGKNLLRITACDGVPGIEAPMGKLLFPEYSWTVELPKEDGTKDFDIPAAAARPPPPGI